MRYPCVMPQGHDLFSTFTNGTGTARCVGCDRLLDVEAWDGRYDSKFEVVRLIIVEEEF